MGLGRCHTRDNGCSEFGRPMVRLCPERGELISNSDAFLEPRCTEHILPLQGLRAFDRIPKNTTCWHYGFGNAVLLVSMTRTLSLLALLGRPRADLFAAMPPLLQLRRSDGTQTFLQQLRRSLIDVEQHGLEQSCALLELKIPTQELFALLANSQARLDCKIHLVNKRGK